MSDLEDALHAIGLGELVHIFRREGFDTWSQLLDISEADLIQCQIKIGHRRRLQRAIQESLAALPQSSQSRVDQQASHPPFNALSTNGSPNFLRAATSLSDTNSSTSPEQQHTVTKRKYRRHPRPDENAPERPSSAYVLFSNRVRERLKNEDLSFTEIAKIVGERWQDPDPRERAACENEAQERKEIYYAELAEYKKTPQYVEYQTYLADFKAKNGEKNAQVQRKPRLNTHSSLPEPPSSNTGVDGVRATPLAIPPYATPQSSSEEQLLDGWYRRPQAGRHESRPSTSTTISGNGDADGSTRSTTNRHASITDHTVSHDGLGHDTRQQPRVDRQSKNPGSSFPIPPRNYIDDRPNASLGFGSAPAVEPHCPVLNESRVRVLPEPHAIFASAMGKQFGRLPPLTSPAMIASQRTPSATISTSPYEHVTLPPIRIDRKRDGTVDWSTGSYSQ